MLDECWEGMGHGVHTGFLCYGISCIWRDSASPNCASACAHKGPSIMIMATTESSARYLNWSDVKQIVSPRVA